MFPNVAWKLGKWAFQSIRWVFKKIIYIYIYKIKYYNQGVEAHFSSFVMVVWISLEWDGLARSQVQNKFGPTICVVLDGLALI